MELQISSSTKDLANSHIDKMYENIIQSTIFRNRPKNKITTLFLSAGVKDRRATVFVSKQKSFDKAWEDLTLQLNKFSSTSQEDFDCFKVDWIEEDEVYSVAQFIDLITKTKKNYFRRGIVLGNDYNYAFLEQEVNGNAFIQKSKKNRRGFLSAKNINYYIRHHRPNQSIVNFNQVNVIRTFTTRGFYYNEGNFYVLKNNPLDNGRRDTPLNNDELKHLITSGTEFLIKNSKTDGKFNYGYFSCFDKPINFYNMLRHSSTLYSMIEAYELFPNKYLQSAIDKGINYLLTKGIRTFDYHKNDSMSFVIDETSSGSSEIKLGANATALLALTKYMSVFKSSVHLEMAQSLARGILDMQNDDGSFTHVLLSSLEIKEEFRIVYYDGEAAFALMRLYQLDKKDMWISSVEKALDFFITNKYWKHHDHWLGYCVNELTTYRPRRKYYEFGLLNIKNKLDFIYHRQTTYPTFLELLLSVYSLVEKIKSEGYEELLEGFDQDLLNKAIQKRAEYQRNGFFYPELSMYFKNPERINGSFFIRHHSFRSRIDDVEHYLSGYCQYYRVLNHHL